MGMTGRINVPGVAENWGDKTPLSHVVGGEQNDKSVKKESSTGFDNDNDNRDNRPSRNPDSATADTQNIESSFPPKYTVLLFQCGTYVAAFADPRKFGSFSVVECPMIMATKQTTDDLTSSTDSDSEDPFYSLNLAPDALTTTNPIVIHETIIPALSNQILGIKGILLDQKRAVSGVGNWIADEVLYQCHLHPDQKYLTTTEATVLWETIQNVCRTAVNCLVVQNTHYPDHWLFGYRWSKKKATKDSLGRPISFLTSGGRTSAIVISVQKLFSRDKSNGVAPQQRQVKQEQVSTPLDYNDADLIVSSGTSHPKQTKKLSASPKKKATKKPVHTLETDVTVTELETQQVPLPTKRKKRCNSSSHNEKSSTMSSDTETRITRTKKRQRNEKNSYSSKIAELHIKGNNKRNNVSKTEISVPSSKSCLEDTISSKYWTKSSNNNNNDDDDITSNHDNSNQKNNLNDNKSQMSVNAMNDNIDGGKHDDYNNHNQLDCNNLLENTCTNKNSMMISKSTSSRGHRPRTKKSSSIVKIPATPPPPPPPPQDILTKTTTTNMDNCITDATTTSTTFDSKIAIVTPPVVKIHDELCSEKNDTNNNSNHISQHFVRRSIRYRQPVNRYTNNIG